MVDLIRLSIEDIEQRIGPHVHPEVTRVVIELHEQNRMLQEYAKELAEHVSNLITALKLSQALHKENKASIDRIEAKYSDPHGVEALKAETGTN
jgi:hypothetical protein